MSDKRYQGNIISKTPVTPTASAASGVWSLAEAKAFKAATLWPTLPDAPTIGTASSGNTSATVPFTVPTNLYGGTAQYTATSNPSGVTGTASSSPVTVTGLTNGTAYTFTVTATTGAGTGAASSASNSITPALGDIGVTAGGGNSSLTHGGIEYVTISSLGNAQDWGNLTVARKGLASGASTTRAVFAYGEPSGLGSSNIIDYVSLTSAGNATDFGDMGASKNNSAGASNGTLAVFSRQSFSAGAYDYVTIASTGNSTSWGNSTRVNETVGTCASPTYGYWCGGDTPVNVIEYLTIATGGDTVDFGDSQTASGYKSLSNGHGGL